MRFMMFLQFEALKSLFLQNDAIQEKALHVLSGKNSLNFLSAQMTSPDETEVLGRVAAVLRICLMVSD